VTINKQIASGWYLNTILQRNSLPNSHLF